MTTAEAWRAATSNAGSPAPLVSASRSSRHTPSSPLAAASTLRGTARSTRTSGLPDRRAVACRSTSAVSNGNGADVAHTTASAPASASGSASRLNTGTRPPVTASGRRTSSTGRVSAERSAAMTRPAM